jgi:polysaccharide biosynthesis protein PslH
LKLMFLLPFAPDLRGTHGGTRATGAIIDMLGKTHRVVVLYLAGAGDPPPLQPPECERLVAIPAEMRATGARTAMARALRAARKLLWGRPQWVEESWSPAMASEVAAVAAEFEPDVVQCEFHVMAQYIPIVRSACPETATIVTEHEPGIAADAVSGAPSTLRERIARVARKRAWSRYERRALRAADAVVVFTESDAAALKRLLGVDHPPIRVIPLRLPSQPQAKPSAPVKSDFLFVGNFRHPPNADAARRLVGSIFPKILRDLPDATLAIVGADPPQDLVDAASDRVTVTGWVDDPSVYLAGAAVVLVPLRQGGGLRVKMLEACGAGKAVVASPLAVEGLSLGDGKEVMIAQTDEEFAQAAIKLIEDSKSRARLERASRHWWEAEHDVGRWSAQYADLYATLGKLDEAQ